MACLPITDSAAVGMPYYGSNGGGGGSMTANPNFSTIGFPSANLATGAAVMRLTDKLLFTDAQPQQGTDFTMSCGDTSGVPGSVSTANTFVIFDPVLNQTYLSLESISSATNIVSRSSTGAGATGLPLNVVASAVNISSLNVSSINGAAPGSGGFFSTLSVALPTQTSTVLMELPPGTWSYNGLATFTGNTNYLNGFANVAASGVPSYYASLFPALSSLTNSPGVVPCEMTLNFNDSPLSTIKLICANNSASLAGTWTGGVFKLF